MSLHHKFDGKFLLKDLGLDGFKELLAAEKTAVPFDSFPIDADAYPKIKVSNLEVPAVEITDAKNLSSGNLPTWCHRNN